MPPGFQGQLALAAHPVHTGGEVFGHLASVTVALVRIAGDGPRDHDRRQRTRDRRDLPRQADPRGARDSVSRAGRGGERVRVGSVANLAQSHASFENFLLTGSALTEDTMLTRSFLRMSDSLADSHAADLLHVLAAGSAVTGMDDSHDDMMESLEQEEEEVLKPKQRLGPQLRKRLLPPP